MNIFKAIDNYHNIASLSNKIATIKIHEYFIKDLKSCLESLNIKNMKRINYDTGYLIVKHFKENTNKGNESINRILMYLKRVIKHFNIESNFIKFKYLAADTQSYQRLYFDDLKLIIDYLNNLNDSKNSIVYKAVIFLLIDSGMRISELLNIKIKNIHYDSTPYSIFLDNTKTGKNRYVPFSDFSYDVIKELLSLNPNNRKYLFWNFIKNRPLIKSDIKLFYRRLKDKIGLDRLYSHQFRKSFASMLVENGMSLEMLQYLLGHSRITTTMIYVQYKEINALNSYNKYNKWGLA
jgi:site-specific recombinase XerD